MNEIQSYQFGMASPVNPPFVGINGEVNKKTRRTQTKGQKGCVFS